MQMKSVILFSGGIDSLIGWMQWEFDAVLDGQRPDAMHVSVGNLAEEYEKKAVILVSELVPKLHGRLVWRTLNLGVTEDPFSGYIPGRNLALLLEAARAGYTRIGLVSQLDEQGVSDRSLAFFQAASGALSAAMGYPVQVDPVFPDIDKTAMLDLYFADLGARFCEDVDLVLSHTTACYRLHDWSRASILPCGACTACFRRAVALANLNRDEQHQRDVWRSGIALAYFKKMSGRYSLLRQARMTYALERAGVIERSGNSWVWKG